MYLTRPSMRPQRLLMHRQRVAVLRRPVECGKTPWAHCRRVNGVSTATCFHRNKRRECAAMRGLCAHERYRSRRSSPHGCDNGHRCRDNGFTVHLPLLAQRTNQCRRE
jgi:hypothetical protein